MKVQPMRKSFAFETKRKISVVDVLSAFVLRSFEEIERIQSIHNHTNGKDMKKIKFHFFFSSEVGMKTGHF